MRVEAEGQGKGPRTEGLFQGQGSMSRVAGVRSRGRHREYGMPMRVEVEGRGSRVEGRGSDGLPVRVEVEGSRVEGL
eukprot:3176147-Rhodomonas_salina.1